VAIGRRDMMAPLLEALPELRPAWETFAAYWPDELVRQGQNPEELPQYLFLSDISNELTAMLEAGRTEDVARAFAVLERWIVEGDDYVRNAAVAGLLEYLGDNAHRRGLPASRFLALLGTEGQRGWRAVNWGLAPETPQADVMGG
jgi:hypothetical protein